MSTTTFIRSNQQNESSSSSSLDTPQPSRRLTFSEIQLATQSFDKSLVIGHGGFGKVYRGTITNGSSLLDVAVKRLESTSKQGAAEFWAEVSMLSNVRHCHLVSLIGYCNDGKEMILVYEYMPNGSLADRLHKCQGPLTWVRRLKICLGAARGLDYLHTDMGVKPRVIHRDVKSSNILLDDNWEAKISDLGLSKIGPTNQPSTYVNTLVKGTFGYLDPNYFQTGKLTRKSDVYAFGVILFEVLSGKQVVDRSIDEEQCGLATWAHESIKEGRVKQIVDPNLRGRISPKCLKEFARLADMCLHSHPKHRPTMAEVVAGLEYILALQEKGSTKFQLAVSGMKIFGRKVPMFLFPSNRENSVEGKSLKSLELYLHSIEGENRILRRFDSDTINVATENFSKANKISEDYLGTMYKGKLQNGQDIAIYEPSFRSAYEEYKNEAMLLVKLEHENLIQLLGICLKGTSVYLVYDFAPYASLDRLLFDPNCGLLRWDERYKILVGVARVILYVHRVSIIHHNVKPGNIFLDESLTPKLSSFAITRCLTSIEAHCINTTSSWSETIGYMAPEYVLTGRFTTKYDVYSFGMLVLETVSGLRISGYTSARAGEHPVHIVWRNWMEGTFSKIIDPKIYFNADLSLMTRFIHIGLLCLQDKATERPTMEEVVGMLVGSPSTALPIPKDPSSWINNDSDSSDKSYESEIGLLCGFS